MAAGEAVARALGVARSLLSQGAASPQASRAANQMIMSGPIRRLQLNILAPGVMLTVGHAA